MGDLISRQAAIDAIAKAARDKFNLSDEFNHYLAGLMDGEKAVRDLPSVQTEPLTVTRDHLLTKDECDRLKQAMVDTPILLFPPAQPTLYGYNIEHLELIARVLQRENLPPERITEMLTDIGRIVAIVSDEFEESLRNAVEQCMS